LEIVIEVLSADAVKITPGASILIDNWGGEQPLTARVRYAPTRKRPSIRVRAARTTPRTSSARCPKTSHGHNAT
jgi:hypothetical protein